MDHRSVAKIRRNPVVYVVVYILSGHIYITSIFSVLLEMFTNLKSKNGNRTHQKCYFLLTLPNLLATRQCPPLCAPEFRTKRSAMEWEVLRHRGQRLDLLLCDFNIFEQYKKKLKHAHWTTVCRRLEVVQAAAQGIFAFGIRWLVQQWNFCLND